MGGYDGVEAGVLPLGGSSLVIEALRLVSPLTFFGGPVSCLLPPEASEPTRRYAGLCLRRLGGMITDGGGPDGGRAITPAEVRILPPPL